MIYIGIDPGLDGGLAVVSTGGTARVYDIPTLKVGKVRKVNGKLLADTIRDEMAFCPTAMVAIESVHSMPDQGVRSVFSFGQSFGVCLGVVAALDIPLELVTPQAWKKVMMAGMQKEKDASRQRAIELFPHLASDMRLKKHHNRADALLIAEYLRRTTGGNDNERSKR